MKALLQRVSRASVTIDGDTVGSIATGLTLFLCVEQDDTEQDADYLKEKCLNLRIFPDEEGRFDRSVLDVGGRPLDNQPIHPGRRHPQGPQAQLHPRCPT